MHKEVLDKNPFSIKIEEKFEEYLRLPSLLELAAMKAYALGRRAKWKDYVDLYFIIKQHFAISQIAVKSFITPSPPKNYNR